MMRAEVGGAVCILVLLLGPAAGAAAQESEIRIDGRIVEDAWEGAVVVSDFVQGEPVEGAAAERPTAVRILFGDDAIYVGARLTEADGEIARQLVRRDETGQADYFQVSFDPNRDRRTGYQFRVSAAGVQQDAYLFDWRLRCGTTPCCGGSTDPARRSSWSGSSVARTVARSETSISPGTAATCWTCIRTMSST